MTKRWLSITSVVVQLELLNIDNTTLFHTVLGLLQQIGLAACPGQLCEDVVLTWTLHPASRAMQVQLTLARV